MEQKRAAPNSGQGVTEEEKRILVELRDDEDDADEDAPDTERSFDAALLSLIDENGELLAGNPKTRIDVATFEEEGVLTRNRGLVVRIGASEFQITIVRSR